MTIMIENLLKVRKDFKGSENESAGNNLLSFYIIWRYRLTNSKGNDLLKAIEEIGCEVQSTGKPTY